jgi:hypothetical protein
MRFAPRLIAVLPSILAALAMPASAQVVRGVLVHAEDGQPVTGTQVLLMRLWSSDPVGSAVTDTAGRFEIGFPGRGRFQLAVQRLEERTEVGEPLTLVPSDTIDVRIDLPAAGAIALTPVVVEATAREPLLERAGFYRRQLSGPGKFLGPAEFEKRRPQRMTDMLQAVNGVRLVPGRFGRPVVVMRRGQLSMRRAECTPRILVDRNEIVGAAAELDLLIDPAVVAGMEIYASNAGVPSEFGVGAGMSACGLILIWTGARPPAG